MHEKYSFFSVVYLHILELIKTRLLTKVSEKTDI